MSTKAPVHLTGIPETMLWTLHNRAEEARRPDGFLHDPDCVRIYESNSRPGSRRSFSAATKAACGGCASTCRRLSPCASASCRPLSAGA